MRVLVPFDATDPKSRLSSVLEAPERREFAAAMLRDVLEAVDAADHDPAVLATAAVDVPAPVTVDDRPLTPAVNAAIDDEGVPVAVLVADLPLVTADAVETLLESAGDVVLAPGLGGGTNGLLVRDPDFRVDFHGASIRDHREAARERGLDAGTVDSFRLAMDVDEPDDLAEVLLHGEGRAADWLRAAEFAISTENGRVGVGRRGDR